MNQPVSTPEITEMKVSWNSLVLVVWLLSQSLSFALPTSPNVAEGVCSPGTTSEQAQAASDNYDARFQPYVDYDVLAPFVTTRIESDWIAQTQGAYAYDLATGFPFQVSASPRAPPVTEAELLAAKTGSELMVHPFSGGGTHITTSARLAAHAESATFGGPSGLFLAPTRQVDSLLASGASRSQMEVALGLNQGALSQGTLMRIDVANPFARNLSLPTSGNTFFRPGGLTWGGLNEGIITSPLRTDPGVLLRPIP